MWDFQKMNIRGILVLKTYSVADAQLRIESEYNFITVSMSAKKHIEHICLCIECKLVSGFRYKKFSPFIKKNSPHGPSRILQCDFWIQIRLHLYDVTHTPYGDASDQHSLILPK